MGHFLVSLTTRETAEGDKSPFYEQVIIPSRQRDFLGLIAAYATAYGKVIDAIYTVAGETSV